MTGVQTCALPIYFSGHGLLDLAAYDAYFAGTLSDVTLSDAHIQELVGAL